MFVVHRRGDGIHIDNDPLPLMDGVLITPEIKKWFHIVDPLWVQLAKQSDKVKNILTRVPE